jgi:hypothetical protein
LSDPRQAASVEHTLLEMVRSRSFGILAGYEDQNDHDALRSDGLFKLIAGRLPTDDDLASQPTLSRFENCVTARSLLNLEGWFLDRVAASFAAVPRSLTLDIDVFDDPEDTSMMPPRFWLLAILCRSTFERARRVGKDAWTTF